MLSCCSFLRAAILQLRVRGVRAHKRPFDEERLRTYTNTQAAGQKVCMQVQTELLQDECSTDPLLQTGL